MNKQTKSRLQNKYNALIFNTVNYSGNYKLGFDLHTDNGHYKVMVKSSETIQNAIERTIAVIDFINQAI